MKPRLLSLFLILAQMAAAQTFTEVTDVPFAGVVQSSIAFADVDGDSDQDVLITGLNLVQQGTPGDRIAKLYTNDGSGSFTEVLGTPFAGVEEGSIAFADVDGDNDQDVLITGRSDVGFLSRLYTNDGSGSFTDVIGTPFQGVNESSIAFADVDGDNDQDVLITGQNSSFTYISKLYTNNGSGIFSEMMNTPFDGVSLSSIAFADVDGDNDQDVLITGGLGGFILPSTGLYANDGSGNFTQIVGTTFDDLRDGSIAFADVDGDNDQDVLLTGVDLSVNYTAKLYLNDGVVSSSNDLFVDTSLDLKPFPNPAMSNNL